MRNVAFFIVILILSFFLVIIVTRNTKTKSQDYQIEVLNEIIEVHTQNEAKSYFLEKQEMIDDSFASVLCFSIYEIENNYVHLTIKDPKSILFVVTNDGITASIVRS